MSFVWFYHLRNVNLIIWTLNSLFHSGNTHTQLKPDVFSTLNTKNFRCKRTKSQNTTHVTFVNCLIFCINNFTFLPFYTGIFKSFFAVCTEVSHLYLVKWSRMSKVFLLLRAERGVVVGSAYWYYRQLIFFSFIHFQ